MVSQFTLNPIEAKTKGEVRRLRQAGFIPVSIQHKGTPTLHFQQEARPLDEFIRRYGEATLLDLWITPENRKQRAIVHFVQRDPVTGKLLQVTFQLAGRDDTLKTHVRLVFQGEPPEVRSKEAFVQHQLERLEIECSPGNLPDSITVNIAHLQPGDVFRVSHLASDPRYKILTPPDTMLASLTIPRSSASAEETPPEAPAAE